MITNIVEGHVNELLNRNKNISEIRMKICKVCPIFQNKLGGICNSNLWLNPITNDVSFPKKDGYIRGCGCRLQAKTTLIDEQCEAHKW